MIRIIISGCCGRMGRQLSSTCQRSCSTEVVAGIEAFQNTPCQYPVYHSPNPQMPIADVLVDFSHPNALTPLLSFCIERKLPILLAATGYDAAQIKEIISASTQIPIFYATNLSIGANILLKLSRYAASLLGPEFDAVITERHHKEKADSPSGTALMLSAVIPQTENILSMRAGTTAGEHTVIFAGPNELIELFHRADTREVYAFGAMRAIRFLNQVNTPGLYGMDDLLN